MNDLDLLSTGLKVGVAAVLVIAIVAVVLFVMFYIEYKRKSKLIIQRANNSKEEILAVDVAYFHEIGKRESQQDSYYISPIEDYQKNGLVALVADGMGGLKYGDEISEDIVNRIEEMYPLSFHAADIIADELRKISNEIYDKYRLQGGSTLAMIHTKKNYLNFYSAGDSDIILIRNGEATVLNPRQKYVANLVKRLAKGGSTTYEAYVDKEARALTDFIGNSNPHIIYTTKPIRLIESDTIIICSDGLTDILPWKTLPQYVSGTSAKRTAEHLKHNIKLKKHPRQDNFTGIVIRFSRDVI